jgi:hypothetical protein
MEAGWQTSLISCIPGIMKRINPMLIFHLNFIETTYYRDEMKDSEIKLKRPQP